MNKFLIIRFSSFGDIVQTMSVISLIKEKCPDAKIYFATKLEFSSLVELEKNIFKVEAFNKSSGFFGFLKYAFNLAKEDFDYVYDAHMNTRSFILKLFLKNYIFNFFFSKKTPLLIARSKERFKRILLFTFRKNLYTWPFKGMKSYQVPLRKWGFDKKVAVRHGWLFKKNIFEKIDRLVPDLNSSEKYIILIPSSAWDLKKWPMNYWIELVKQLPSYKFIILGGKNDSYLGKIKEASSERTINLIGKLSLIESCAVISKSSFTVSGDTGLMHVGDLLGIPGIALIGPSAFGFPTGKNVETVSIDLDCRPCSKDGRNPCTNKVYQKCLVDISPNLIACKIKNYFES